MAVWQKIECKNLAFGLRLDPEFYRPDYLELRKKLKKIGTHSLLEIKEDIGYGLQAEPEYLKQGVDYIRALNLKDIGISGEILKIDQNQIPSANYLGVEGDVLITRSGANCGDTGIIEDGFIGATYGSYIIRIRVKNLNPFFVLAFLQSKYGRFQTIQIRTGLAQPNLSIPYIENLIQIPRNISNKIQNKTEILLKTAFQKQREIISLYKEMGQELLERMKWDKVDIKHTLDYSTTSKDIFGNERVDPEFYQPKFRNLIKHLKKSGSIKLGNFCPIIKRGVSPQYSEEGEVFIVNSKNLEPTGLIDISSLDKTSLNYFNEEKNKNAQLSQFDVLTYATGAYIGRTNAWLENVKAIAGIDCIISQPQKNICNPIYLSLFLNSFAGLMQADQKASGSAQRHLYPKDLREYEVFIPQNKTGKPDLEWQEKLANKIIHAYEAKKEAKQNLQKAKGLVEKAIEKDR